MIDREKLEHVLTGYKKYFLTHWEDEKYKWEAVQHFQKYWQIEAENFEEMLREATSKTYNLLSSGYAYPRSVILNFAKEDAEAVRQMFRGLYDEERDLGERVTAFQAAAHELNQKYDDGSKKNHFQNTNAISTYLWMKFPDKYYIYRYELFRDTAKELNASYPVRRDGSVESMLNGFRMYDEICRIVQQDAEISDLLKKRLEDPACYSDPKMKTATMDIGFYLSRFYLPEQRKKAADDTDDKEWWPKDYDPGISVEVWGELLRDHTVFDKDSLEVVKRLKDCGGQATCKQLSERYGKPVNFYNRVSSALGKRIAEKTNCPLLARENGAYRYWPVLYTGRDAGVLTDGSFIWKLRREFAEALENADLSYDGPDIRSRISTVKETSQIDSYSSPQGFWWLTANPRKWSFDNIKVGEEKDFTLYNENGHQRKIFQNFQDVQAGDPVICYETNPVKKAVALGKITRGSDGKAIYVEKCEALPHPVEYAVLKDCPELEKMEFFARPNGTLFKLTRDEYEFVMDMIRDENPLKQTADREAYTKADFLREVFMEEERYNVLRALIRNKKNVILQGAPGVGKTFAAKRLAYSMMGEKDDERVKLIQFHQNYSYEDFIMGYRPSGAEFNLEEGIFYRFCKTAENDPDKEYFFIIDEINRGNLSKIFGELMMLIEKDYRGTKAALAYNGMLFSVPENLYLIGMMNTADRSLALIDYALRRRFSFFEMEPGFAAEGFVKYQESFASETFDALIDKIKQLNREIAKDESLGRGFRIGHSYFCGRETEGVSEEWLRSVVEFDILPTLNEYWFDDQKKLETWERNLRGVFDDQ